MTAVELFQTDGIFKTRSKILQGASWIKCTNAEFPRGAVVSGTEDGHLHIVVRTTLSGDDGGLIPGKFYTIHQDAYFPQDGFEAKRPTYEVLVAKSGSLIWLISSDGIVLPNAVIGGKTSSGELLFIGRARHRGMWVGGKIQPSTRQCIVPYGGKAWAYNTYEILIGLDPVLPEGSKLAETTSNSSKSADLTNRPQYLNEESIPHPLIQNEVTQMEKYLQEHATHTKKSSTKHHNKNQHQHHKSSKSMPHKKSK